jgi:PAS domain S-box-containing protein/diguanylate cyclase (GGDEF)-like protein
MEEHHEFYWQLLDTLKDGVYFADKKRQITYWNKAAEEITGFKANEVLGRHCGENFLNHIDEAGNSLCTGVCPLARAMETGEARQDNIFLHHRDGHRIPVHVRINPVKDRQGEVVGAVEIFSERAVKDLFLERVKILQRDGFIEEATGIPNQKLMAQHLKTRFWVLNQYQRTFGAVLMKIDDMEEIKKNAGEGEWQEALKKIGRTFNNNMTSLDLVGHWHGETFLGIFLNVDADKLKRIANLYRVLVSKTRTIFVGEPRPLTVSNAAVLAVPGEDENTILEKAELLLTRAQGAGNKTLVY